MSSVRASDEVTDRATQGAQGARAPADRGGGEAERPSERLWADRAWGLVQRVNHGAREPENWVQLFKFGLVGVSGYVVNLIVFAILNQGLDVHHIPAAVGAFVVAVTNNFLWNRHWTFDAGEGHAGYQAARFLTVSLIGLGVNLVALALLVDVAGLAELPGQALAVAIAMPVNFLGNKLWTFDR
jgi:dolichol-phosphate mannosyltransferase